MRHGARAYRSALRHLPGRLAPVLECVVNISEGRRVDLVEAIGAAAGPRCPARRAQRPRSQPLRPDARGRGRPEGGHGRGGGPARPAGSRGGPSPVRGRRRGAVRAAGGRRHRGGRVGAGRLRPLGIGDARPALLPLRTRALAPPSAEGRVRRAGPRLRASPAPPPASDCGGGGGRRPAACWSPTTCGSPSPTSPPPEISPGGCAARPSGLWRSRWATTSRSRSTSSRPDEFGPDDAYDAVAEECAVARAELVGLIPASVLRSVPAHRWTELDLAADRTIEARLEARGWS